MNSTNSHGSIVDTTAEPLAPPPENVPRKQPGRPKGGWPSERAAKAAAAAEPASKKPGQVECPQCGTRIAPMTLDLAHELVRSARDELPLLGGDSAGLVAMSRLQYLASRLDGYCGYSCYRKVYEG